MPSRYATLSAVSGFFISHGSFSALTENSKLMFPRSKTAAITEYTSCTVYLLKPRVLKADVRSSHICLSLSVLERSWLSFCERQWKSQMRQGYPLWDLSLSALRCSSERKERIWQKMWKFLSPRLWLMILLFSRKQFLMEEWYIFMVSGLMRSPMSLPNRLELSFFIVRALPKTYRMGSHCRIIFSILEVEMLNILTTSLLQKLIALSACLFVQVLPDPDSPLMLITCTLVETASPLRMWNMKEQMCGSCLRMSSYFTQTDQKQLERLSREYCQGIALKGLTMIRLFHRQVWIFCSASLRFSWRSTSGALMMSISIRSLSIELLSLHFSSWCALTSKETPCSVMPVTLEFALLMDRGTTPLMTPLTQRSLEVQEGRQIQHRVSLVIHERSKLSLAFLLALLMFKNQINHNNKHPAPLCLQYYRIMGNEQASETSISLTKQDREDWFKVEEQGFCELWANKKTGKRFQAYPIPDSIAKDKVQVEKYVFRKLHASTLVSAEAIVSQNQAFLCSQPSTSFVLIENIVNRLRSFSRCFNFEEVLYILASSSSGFNTLSSFFGPLEPNEDMICFNDEGRVKVWLNENLSKNQASVNAKAYDSDLHKGEDYNVAQRRSKQCVDKLFRITEASASAPFPQDFKEEIKNFSTFFQLSNFIQFYSQQKGIRVPERVQLKREITSAMSPRPVQNAIIYSSRPSLQLNSLESSRVKQVFQPVSTQKISLPPSYVVSQSRQLQAAPVTFTVGPPLQNHKVSITYPCSQTVITPPGYSVAVSQKISTAVVPQQPRVFQEKREQIAEAESIAELVALAQQKPAVVPVVESVNIQRYQQIIKVQQKPQVKEQPLQKAQEQIKKIYTFHEQPQIFVNYTQKYEQVQQNVQVYREPEQVKEVHSEPQVDQQPISESIYSQIQSYVPPVRQPQQHQIIDETKEEDYPSPKKQSNEIDEWEERLNKFTNSQHIQQRQQVFNISTREVKEQTHQAHTEEPESFKNLKVTEQKEEYVNELVDLESDDIEKYIRMKYQSYISEHSQPVQNNYKEEYNYEEKPSARVSARAELKSNAYTYEPQQEDYTSYYKPYEYRETAYQREEITEKENYPSDYRYDPKTSYDNRASIQQEFPQYSSRRNSGEYNYEKAKPLVEEYSYDYRQGNNLKSKKGSRNSQVIDEKYSKYVLNSQKPPKSPSFIKPLEEVSLILPQDESFIHNRSYIPAPIYQKSGQASILSKNSQRKGITYQKLRNLLWQD